MEIAKLIIETVTGILANDSCLSAEGTGVGYVRASNQEAACAMLEELAVLERDEWEPSSPAAA